MSGISIFLIIIRNQIYVIIIFFVILLLVGYSIFSYFIIRFLKVRLAYN